MTKELRRERFLSLDVFRGLTICFMIIVNAPGLSFYDWVNQVFFQRIAPGPFGTLLFAVFYMLCCWSVGLWLDKRKIYIKI